MKHPARLVLAGFFIALAFSSRADARFTGIPVAESRTDLGTYELDHIERRMLPSGRCPEVPLVDYRGEIIPYERAVRIHQAFVPRVQLLERIIYDAAVETYGRPPRRLTHRGAYNCRAVRGIPSLLSEHGLGNALDWSGADFAALRPGDPSPPSLPPRLRRSFRIRVATDYRETRGIAMLHARFFQLVRARLIEEPHLSGVLGPGYPGHEDHFHIDVAPWILSYIDRIEVDPPVASRPIASDARTTQTQ